MTLCLGDQRVAESKVPPRNELKGGKNVGLGGQKISKPRRSPKISIMMIPKALNTRTIA